MFMLPSKRLILSYVFDWIIILGIAAVGVGFNRIGPFRRPFSVVDLSISFPHAEEQVPAWLLFVVALFAPAAIIFIVCLIFVPGPAVSKRTPAAQIWRRKFWEWNTGWMGLGMSLATAWMITEGMKNLFGKPRPDLLDRCQPDLENIAAHAVSNYAAALTDRWVLVTSSICQTTDTDTLTDGFRSFPSGHSSSSWAGLLYLTLFLCSKFAIAFPFLPAKPFNGSRAILPMHVPETSSADDQSKPGDIEPLPSTQAPYSSEALDPLRNSAAAPPVWVLVIGLVPIGAAVYVTSSRYADYRHHGFDVLFGSFIGIVCAYFSFRWYHLPISRGAGWSWGARSKDRAFGIGVGVGGYVGSEGWR